MKKVCCLLVAISCLLLSSCVTYNSLSDEINERLSYYYDYDELIENLSKVEIVALHETKGIAEITVLKTFSYEESSELLYDFSKIKQTEVVPIIGGPTGQSGTSIRVWYLDGTNEIYSRDGATDRLYGRCSSEEDFDNLINKYLN